MDDSRKAVMGFPKYTWIAPDGREVRVIPVRVLGELDDDPGRDIPELRKLLTEPGVFDEDPS